MEGEVVSPEQFQKMPVGPNMERKIEKTNSYEVTKNAYQNLMKHLKGVKFDEKKPLSAYADIKQLLAMLHSSLHALHQRWANTTFVSGISPKHMKETHETLLQMLIDLEDLTMHMVEERKKDFQEVPMMKVTEQFAKAKGAPTYA
jgi:hypothetical protein